ncbi:CLUMA_CG016368, isoform A [Clunio marinus]|uniref:CLUMA_CG016368, isoform A n=1 Tax=Clunio marinus TaxID=568069 RepID=A0A1J1IT73_9DIPT|nr:CLUMA_CG016368, isoform A [Clunio marinus]
MSNANPPDPTRNHPDKIASNNKVIVLSMKNMPTLANFKFDPSKNFLASGNPENNQQVFSFKPQQLVQSSVPPNPSSQQMVQVIQQQTSTTSQQKISSPSGKILIRAQSTPSSSKPQMTSINKVQETSKITNVNKEISSATPQTVTAFRSKSTSDVTMKTPAGHTLLLQAPMVIKNPGNLAATTLPSSLKNVTFSHQPPPTLSSSSLPRVTVSGKIPATTQKIVSSASKTTQSSVTKPVPIRPKIDSNLQQNIVIQAQPQPQKSVLSIPIGTTAYARFNATTQKWMLPASSTFSSAVPPLARIQPKPLKVTEKLLDDDEKEEMEVPAAAAAAVVVEKTPEKLQKRTSQEERFLEVKRIIEGDDDEEINLNEEREAVEESPQKLTSEIGDSSSSMLLCDEKIENVSPDVTPPDNNEKKKEDATTPTQSNGSDNNVDTSEINSSMNDVKKNLEQALKQEEECDKENFEIVLEEDSISDTSSLSDVKRRKLQDYEESLTKTEIITKKDTEQEIKSVVETGKSKRTRKAKNPTIIATLGLPYKPSQPSGRKSKGEKKLEFELDFHDPLNKIQWDDGIGGLNNCNKLFGYDEFGLLEVINKKDAMAKLKQLEPTIKIDNTSSIKLRKIVDPIDQFVCMVCSKMGTIRDFFSPECCSESCLAITKRKTSEFNVVGGGGRESSSESGVTTPVDERKLMFGGEMIPLQQLQQHLLEQQVPGSKRVRNKRSLIAAPEMKFQWDTYLTEKSVPAPLNLFQSPYPRHENPFKVGMRVEAIDPENQKMFCVCTVEEKLGYRIKLHFDGFSPNYDFWVNADSPNIFPAGFCQSNNRVLNTPPRWTKQKFDWSEYLDRTNSIGAQRSMFPRLMKASSEVLNESRFKIGDKLEAMNDDKLYAATIIDLLDNRMLIEFDGHPEIGCKWKDIFSPYLRPCNYHLTVDYPFISPTNPPFDWKDYLKSTESEEATIDFLIYRKREVNCFEPGHKVEVVDPVNRQLIRPATILRRDHFKIQVIFDGFDISFAFWLDDDSEDIHPINWCEKTGHPIEHPAGFNKSIGSDLCPTAGCRGIGNGTFTDRYFHDNVAECPYEKQNWKKILNRKLGTRLDTKILAKRNIKLVNQDISSKTKEVNSKVKRENFDDQVMIIDDSVEASTTMTTATKSRGRKHKIVKTESSNLIEMPEKKLKLFKDFLEDYGPQFQYSYNLWKENSKVLKRAELCGSLTQNPNEWSVYDVGTFLTKFIDDIDIVAQFKEQEIDGRALMCLCQDDLTNLMTIKAGPSIKIYNRIMELREEVFMKFINV